MVLAMPFYTPNRSAFVAPTPKIEINTAATGTSTAPNSTTLTTTFGAVDQLFMSIGAYFNSGSLSSGPSGYSGASVTNSNNTGTQKILSAWKLNIADDSDDPGAWTMSASQQWRAYTMAIKGNCTITSPIYSASVTPTTALAMPQTFIDTISPGDLVLCISAVRHSSAVTFLHPDGFTPVINQIGAGNMRVFAVYWTIGTTALTTSYAARFSESCIVSSAYFRIRDWVD